jgi:hypothetical protein
MQAAVLPPLIKRLEGRKEQGKERRDRRMDTIPTAARPEGKA